MKKRKKILIVLGSVFLFIIFLMYGPITYFKDLWITSAMTTYNHKFLATFFYSDKTIQKVLDRNKVIIPDFNTNLDLIDIDNSNINYDKYDKEILTKDKGNNLYKVIEIKGTTFTGFLTVIYDPSKISLATTKYIGKKGELITDMAKDNNAIISINGGGFYDPLFNGDGGLPSGILIQNNKIINNVSSNNHESGIIGFTNDNKLFLGNVTAEKALELGIRDCVEFGPFLIVNGKSSSISGNGGWGYAPRTVIGQRSDGIVLFLTIDGRKINSLGADMVQLTKIMEKYKVINAANLDGGSSTALVINNKIINSPTANTDNGLRNINNSWYVK